MSFIDIIQDKDKLKNDMLHATFFITLYENFKNSWKEEILYFYANEFSFENGCVKPLFTKVDGRNSGGTIRTTVDKDAENNFYNEVYRTIVKANGGYDKEASMFNWLLRYELISKNHYDKLIEIRDLRNKLVHELDTFINDGFPNNIAELTQILIEIRECSSKQWFINFELPISGDGKFDDDGNLIVPDEVISVSNFSFKMLYKSLFEK